MAELFSQYASGIQFTAGAIAGNVDGTSGINPVIDRLNSITQINGVISGTKYLTVHGATMSYGSIWLLSGTGAEIRPSLSTRKNLLVYNNSTDSVYVGESGVTYNTGYEVPANDFVQLVDTGSVYGVLGSGPGSLNVRFMEI